MRDLIIPSLAGAVVICVGLTIVPPLQASCADPGEAASSASHLLAEQLAHLPITIFYAVMGLALLVLILGGQFLIVGLIARAFGMPLLIPAILCAGLILIEVEGFGRYMLYADDGCGNPQRHESPWDTLIWPSYAVIACVAGVAFTTLSRKAASTNKV